MRKGALIGCVIVLGLVFAQVAIGQEEELKVPFSAIRSSCYGEIDMTKADFSLSEVGEKCVKKEWLEKNKPEPTESELPSDFPIEKLVEKEPNLVDVVKVIDTPRELQKFMNGYFTIETHGGTVAYSPSKFLKVKKGVCKDWAVFATHILRENNYKAETVIFSHNYRGGGHVISVYWDEEGQIYYLTTAGIFDKHGPFSSMKEVMESEKQRLGHPKIVAWATVPQGSYATQKALGPAQAEAALEKLPSALNVNLGDLTPKKGKDYLQGILAEIKEEPGNTLTLKVAVNMKHTFKDPSKGWVLQEFETTRSTKYSGLVYPGFTPTEAEIENLYVGANVIITVKEPVTKIGNTEYFTADKVTRMIRKLVE